MSATVNTRRCSRKANAPKSERLRAKTMALYMDYDAFLELAANTLPASRYLSADTMTFLFNIANDVKWEDFFHPNVDEVTTSERDDIEAMLAKAAQDQTIDYRNRLADFKEQQLKQDKDAKDLERERRTADDLVQKRASLQRSYDRLKELHFEIPMLQYKELMAQAKGAVIDTDREKLEAKANAVIENAQKSFRNNPMARDYEKLLFPEIDFDAYYSKQSAPQAKTVSLNDMPQRP